MIDQPRSASSAIVLGKSLISVIVGGLTWLLANALAGGREWGLLFSAFVGSVVLLVQFLHHFERRLGLMELSVSEHQRNIEAVVQRRFTEISQIVELFSLVEESAMRTEVVQFLRNAVAIDASPQLRHELAHSEIGRITEFLGELQNGFATYYGEDRDWLLGLARKARKSIDAISLPSVDGGRHGFDEGFWDSDLGSRYLECQRDAVEQRAVSVRRILVQEPGNEQAQVVLENLCALHTRHGVQVRILDPKMIPPGVGRALLDFIIFDDVVGYEVTPGAHPGKDMAPTIVNTRLVLRSDAVGSHRLYFDKLWEVADPFDPSTSRAA